MGQGEGRRGDLGGGWYSEPNLLGVAKLWSLDLLHNTGWDGLDGWMKAVEIVLEIDAAGELTAGAAENAAESIVTTARDTANLYLMQLEQSV